MEKKLMRRVVLILILVSLAIYALQILIFRDPETTAFYIFQDFAFMPATTAIATLIVGELINKQERKSRQNKTRMLTSTFFTQVGTELAMLLVNVSDPSDTLHQLMIMRFNENMNLTETLHQIDTLQIRVKLTEEVYTKSMELLHGAQTALMVLSSNPLLFEHEDFTDLLWTIFHLIDEYKLRGEYKELSKSDIAHLNVDYSEMMRLLMKSYISNSKYIYETYPNLYQTAKEKIENML